MARYGMTFHQHDPAAVKMAAYIQDPLRGAVLSGLFGVLAMDLWYVRVDYGVEHADAPVPDRPEDFRSPRRTLFAFMAPGPVAAMVGMVRSCQRDSAPMRVVLAAAAAWTPDEPPFTFDWDTEAVAADVAEQAATLDEAVATADGRARLDAGGSIRVVPLTDDEARELAARTQRDDFVLAAVDRGERASGGGG